MSEQKDIKAAQRKKRQWEEVEEYRALLETPDRFDEGFTLRTIIGVLFISLIMTPGEMFLGLFTSAIQALIFATLAAYYIGEAVEEHH